VFYKRIHRPNFFDSSEEMSSDMRIVQETWGKISGNLTALGEVFYTKLFQMYPILATTVYKNVPMKVQAIRLMHMIDTCVELLEKPAYMLLDELLKLGHRHYLYGVRLEHYPWVFEALAATLQEKLGSEFTEDVATAWTRIYGIIVDTMLRGGEAAMKKDEAKKSAAATTA
jgi:hemoglobin-like flavoprotein